MLTIVRLRNNKNVDVCFIGVKWLAPFGRCGALLLPLSFWSLVKQNIEKFRMLLTKYKMEKLRQPRKTEKT